MVSVFGTSGGSDGVLFANAADNAVSGAATFDDSTAAACSGERTNVDTSASRADGDSESSTNRSGAERSVRGGAKGD